MFLFMSSNSDFLNARHNGWSTNLFVRLVCWSTGFNWKMQVVKLYKPTDSWHFFQAAQKQRSLDALLSRHDGGYSWVLQDSHFLTLFHERRSSNTSDKTSVFGTQCSIQNYCGSSPNWGHQWHTSGSNLRCRNRRELWKVHQEIQGAHIWASGSQSHQPQYTIHNNSYM